MLGLLAYFCPAEFTLGEKTLEQLFKAENLEELAVYEEILIQVKSFFINRNLDGKGLFRVLFKQAQQEFQPKDTPSLSCNTVKEEL